MNELKQDLDPRIARTKSAVQLAVLKLLSKEHPFSALTISEVALAAGITRKTLYARFGSLEQVIEEMALNMFEETAENITDEMLMLPLTDGVSTTVVFRAYEEHKEILTPLLKFCPGFLFVEPCKKVTGALLDRTISVNQFNAPPAFERQYLIAILCSTLHATLSVWIERGFTDSPDQLSDFMVKLLGPGVDAMLKSLA